MKYIAVLGTGPAGLMAAQAVSLVVNAPLVIFSGTDQPSRLGGAQFLHAAIPMINDPAPDTMITYRVRGTEEEYRRKVYGREEVPFTSFQNVKDGDTQEAWNLQATYERLWDKFRSNVERNVTKIDASWFDNEWIKDFSHIFSSIPLPSICQALAGASPETHHFKSQQIHVCVERFGECPPDTIIYDGTTEARYYRKSQIFGVPGTEWAHNPPPIKGLIKDSKPVSTTCTCHPNVTRVGRRGTWTKGVLTHDAFIAAWRKMHEV